MTSGKVEEKEFHLVEFLKAQGEAFCRRLELEGKPETLNKSWPIRRAGIVTGFISGGHLGYTLATRLAQMPSPANQESEHPELPFEKEEIPREPASKA